MLLEKCCEQALRDGIPVALVLRDLTSVDSAGQALLRQLAERDLCLSANGVYVPYLLDNVHGNVSADQQRSQAEVLRQTAEFGISVALPADVNSLHVCHRRSQPG